MGNRHSQQKKKLSIFGKQQKLGREQQCQSQGISVISCVDHASLQEADKIMLSSEQIPPSPCPVFPERNTISQSPALQSFCKNADYLTPREVLAGRELYHAEQFESKTDNNESDIQRTENTKRKIELMDYRGLENDDSIYDDDVDGGDYDSINPRSPAHEPCTKAFPCGCDNIEQFQRGSFPRMSERTVTSKDSAFTTDSSTNGHRSFKDDIYMCLNCSVCRPQPIEYMVDVYKKRLQSDLRVEDILKDLHCIDDLHKEEIERKSQESRKAAVDMLLEHIWLSSEQGKWQNFIEALERAGHSAIVKLLKAETENDAEDKRRLLALMSRQLVYSIHVDTFLDMLYEAELLTEEDKDIIESEKQNSQLAAAHKIFNILPTKSHDWAQRLPEILKKCGLVDDAELLLFSEERPMSPETDETDLKKGKCKHNKHLYQDNHHGNNRHLQVIERKADFHNNALKKTISAQQRDIDKFKHNFNELVSIIHHHKKQEDYIENELKSQRILIQNMEQMHKQEFNDLRNSLTEIRSLMSELTKIVSPPKACHLLTQNSTADSGFSGGLCSIPEDNFDSEINSEFVTSRDDLKEGFTKL